MLYNVVKKKKKGHNLPTPAADYVRKSFDNSSGMMLGLFCLELTLKFGCVGNRVQGNPLLCGWSTGTECPGDPPLPLMANVNGSTQCKLTVHIFKVRGGRLCESKFPWTTLFVCYMKQ
jgi:hypothetical protein